MPNKLGRESPAAIASRGGCQALKLCSRRVQTSLSRVLNAAVRFCHQLLSANTPMHPVPRAEYGDADVHDW